MGDFGPYLKALASRRDVRHAEGTAFAGGRRARKRRGSIGSGAIEAASKHLVKARLCASGAHWRRENIPKLLAGFAEGSADRGIDIFFQVIEQLKYHGQTEPLIHVIRQMSYIF